MDIKIGDIVEILPGDLSKEDPSVDINSKYIGVEGEVSYVGEGVCRINLKDGTGKGRWVNSNYLKKINRLAANELLILSRL